MMERLTERNNCTTHENGICCTHFLSPECPEVSGDCSDGCKWEEAVWNTIAAYEDSGLSPIACEEARKIEDGLSEHDYSIERMVKLMQADKDGRVVVLPAKTVYELVWDAGSNCDGICPVSIDGIGCCDFCDAGELCIHEVPCKQEHIERIGDDVFLTYEEAENGLEKLKNG